MGEAIVSRGSCVVSNVTGLSVAGERLLSLAALVLAVAVKSLLALSVMNLLLMLRR